MWRLNRRLRAERGATAVLVAILLVPLIGIAAFAIDVGALFAERAQLQNGVDGAALAVAAACAKDESTCSTKAQGIAQDYVAGNASIPRGATANAPVVDMADNTVTVTARTDVDHILAGVLIPDRDSEQVGASGSAEWGTPVAGSTVPIAIGACEFEEYPPLDPADPSPKKILVQYDTEDRKGCDATFSPGGFGWLDAEDCLADIDLSAGEVWHKADRGNSMAKSGCDVEDDLVPLLDTTVLIPIYDSFKKVNGECTEANDDKGGTVCFHIEKFAAFTLTGFKLSGGDKYSDSSAPKCTGNCRGLQGYFVKYVSVDEAFTLGDGDSSTDLSVVRLVITAGEMADLTD